jgi:hypothetical protein
MPTAAHDPEHLEAFPPADVDDHAGGRELYKNPQGDLLAGGRDAVVRAGAVSTQVTQQVRGAVGSRHHVRPAVPLDQQGWAGICRRVVRPYRRQPCEAIRSVGGSEGRGVQRA